MAFETEFVSTSPTKRQKRSRPWRRVQKIDAVDAAKG